MNGSHCIRQNRILEGVSGREVVLSTTTTTITAIIIIKIIIKRFKKPRRLEKIIIFLHEYNKLLVVMRQSFSVMY